MLGWVGSSEAKVKEESQLLCKINYFYYYLYYKYVLTGFTPFPAQPLMHRERSVSFHSIYVNVAPSLTLSFILFESPLHTAL